MIKTICNYKRLAEHGVGQTPKKCKAVN